MSADPAFYVRDNADLPLFAPEPPAPSVARAGSERAADLLLNSPFRRKSWRRILLYLAQQSVPVSREQISGALGIPQHSLCGRLSELNPQFVETFDSACISKANIRVQGYALTDIGRARIKQAQKPIAG
jgi:hypothetical protein